MIYLRLSVLVYHCDVSKPRRMAQWMRGWKTSGLSGWNFEDRNSVVNYMLTERIH